MSSAVGESDCLCVRRGADVGTTRICSAAAISRASCFGPLCRCPRRSGLAATPAAAAAPGPAPAPAAAIEPLGRGVDFWGRTSR
eukprot:1290551-Prymnesium_polylepis.1